MRTVLLGMRMSFLAYTGTAGEMDGGTGGGTGGGAGTCRAGAFPAVAGWSEGADEVTAMNDVANATQVLNDWRFVLQQAGPEQALSTAGGQAPCP